MRKRESWNIDLAELIEDERIRTAQSLKVRIEELQEQIAGECARQGWSRSTSYKRRLVTSLGAVELTVVKVRRGGRVTSPILDALGIRRWRYSGELRMLLADEMEGRGYLKTSRFIRSHARFMVTFAKVALERGIRIPYTSNAVERMMGEISKRCKHKWMSWSTNGLENMLLILLFRYAEP